MFRQVFQVKYKIYELEEKRKCYEKCTTKDSKVYWYDKVRRKSMWKEPSVVSDLKNMYNVWENVKERCAIESMKLFKKSDAVALLPSSLSSSNKELDNTDDDDDNDGEEPPPGIADLDPEENIKRIMFGRRSSLGYVENAEEDFDSESTFTDEDDEDFE